jgi:hypothetical protein
MSTSSFQDQLIVVNGMAVDPTVHDKALLYAIAQMTAR